MQMRSARKQYTAWGGYAVDPAAGAQGVKTRPATATELVQWLLWDSDATDFRQESNGANCLNCFLSGYRARDAMLAIGAGSFTHDMLNEMRLAVILSKAISRQLAFLEILAWCCMATISGTNSRSLFFVVGGQLVEDGTVTTIDVPAVSRILDGGQQWPLADTPYWDRAKRPANDLSLSETEVQS